MIIHLQINNIISINYKGTHHASLENEQARSYTTTYAASTHVLCPTKRKEKYSKRKESISYVYNISIIPVKIVIQISKFVVPKKVENHVRNPTIKVKKMENHFDQRQTK
jgi:hypothetical protein